jgi:hypothetical protein
LHEYVDVKLCANAELAWHELPARLNEATQDGLEFFAAEPLSPGDLKLSQVIQEAHYVVGLPASSLALCGVADAEALQALFDTQIESGLRTRRVVEGIGKWVDVKQFLLHARAGTGASALEVAGVAAQGLLPVQIALRFTDTGTAKISEALATLTGQRELPAHFMREQLRWRIGVNSGQPLEIERLRSVQREAPVTKLGTIEAGAAELA